MDTDEALFRMPSFKIIEIYIRGTDMIYNITFIKVYIEPQNRQSSSRVFHIFKYHHGYDEQGDPCPALPRF